MIGRSGSSAVSDGRLASQAARSALFRGQSSILAAAIVSSRLEGQSLGQMTERGHPG